MRLVYAVHQNKQGSKNCDLTSCAILFQSERGEMYRMSVYYAIYLYPSSISTVNQICTAWSVFMKDLLGLCLAKQKLMNMSRTKSSSFIYKMFYTDLLQSDIHLYGRKKCCVHGIMQKWFKVGIYFYMLFYFKGVLSDCVRFFSNFLRFWYQKKAHLLITPGEFQS